MGAVDLLRPFNVSPSSFTVSTTGDPYRRHGFTLRFMHLTEFTQVPNDVMEQHLSRLLCSYDCAAQLAEAETINSAPSTGASPPNHCASCWVHAFRDQLACALRNSEGATLDHPVGCVLVASSAQHDPGASFKALLASANLAPAIADGVADPGFSRAYILLHDVSDSTADDTAAQAALAGIINSFGGASCHLIAINSRTPDAQLPRDIWRSELPRHCSTFDASRWLPDDSPLASKDADQLRELIQGPITNQVIASLQTRVISLSSTVKSTRAGLQSKLRSWLGARSTLHGNGSGPPISNRTNQNSVRYSYGSIEAQTRQLADCAFLLGDYV